MKKTIEAVYAEKNDITFIMEHIQTDNGEPIQTAVIGWYHGEPDETGTWMYYGKLTAKYK